MPEPPGTLEDGGITLLPGKHPHPPWTGRMLDDLDAPPQLPLDPSLACAGIALIQPDVGQTPEQILHALEHLRHGRPILHVGGVHRHGEQQSQRHPEGTREEMPLAAAELLAAIIAADAATLVVLAD